MKLTIPGGVVLGAVLTTGCVVTLDSESQVSREEKRFSVSGTADVRLTTFDGSIQIQSWDKPEVLVEIERRGPSKEAIDALQVRSEQQGAVVEVEVKRPRRESVSGIGIGFYRSASARLIVTVPRHTDVRAKSGDGSIRLDGVTGRLDLRTGDGAIRVNEASGELTLNTGDGSVTVDGVEGRLTLETGDGGVNVSGKLSGVRLHTADGSIVYRAQPGSAMVEDWEITTGDGGVSLYLPQDFDAELDAHTGDGRIRNDLSLAGRSDGEVNRRTVRGRLGEGGRRLRIRTGDGSIRLRTS